MSAWRRRRAMQPIEGTRWCSWMMDAPPSRRRSTKPPCFRFKDPSGGCGGRTRCSLSWNGEASGRGASLGPANGPHLATPRASTEELIAAIGLEPRHSHSRRHLECLQNLSRSRIDSPQLTFVILPGTVPELSLSPGDAGHEAIGLDGAKDRPGLWIDLMDLALPILPHPERPLGPCKPGVPAAAGRRNRGEHEAGLRIDLLDAIASDLKDVLTVEGRAGVRRDVDRALHLSTHWIEGLQLVSGSKPDALTVVGDPVHVVDTRKRPILADDLGSRSIHVSILVAR